MPASRASADAIGEQVRRLPLHPRLARMLVAAGGARQIAQACALLSERHLLPPRTASTTSDLLSAIDDWQRDAAARAARGGRHCAISDCGSQIRESAIAHPQPAASPSGSAERSWPGIPIAWHNAANPDRRTSCSRPAPARRSRARAASATANSWSRSTCADLNPQSTVQSAIRHPQSGLRKPQAALSVPKGAMIRMASLVERDWLAPTSADVVHRFDDARVSEGRRRRPL